MQKHLSPEEVTESQRVIVRMAMNGKSMTEIQKETKQPAQRIKSAIRSFNLQNFTVIPIPSLHAGKNKYEAGTPVSAVYEHKNKKYSLKGVIASTHLNYRYESAVVIHVVEDPDRLMNQYPFRESKAICISKKKVTVLTSK